MNGIGLGDLAVLVTVAGVTVYVLGVIGLAIPMYRTFTFNMSTAWYASTLLPRTVVAGQGLRIWLKWPIALTVIFLFLAGISAFVLAYESITADVVAVALLTFPVLIVPWIEIWKFRSKHKRRRAKRAGVTARTQFEALMLQFSLWGALIMQAASYLIVAPLIVGHPLKETWGSSFFTSHHILAGTIMLFFGGFLIGASPASRASPPLPRVTIATTSPEDRKSRKLPRLHGHLVAHSDGFWHLIVEAERKHQLLSVPDGSVLEVRMLGEEPEATTDELASEEDTTPDQENGE